MSVWTRFELCRQVKSIGSVKRRQVGWSPIAWNRWVEVRSTMRWKRIWTTALVFKMKWIHFLLECVCMCWCWYFISTSCFLYITWRRLPLEVWIWIPNWIPLIMNEPTMNERTSKRYVNELMLDNEFYSVITHPLSTTQSLILLPIRTLVLCELITYTITETYMHSFTHCIHMCLLRHHFVRDWESITAYIHA